ncbi:hypothetical protein ACX3VG_26025, partial [Escherichia coli]
MSFEDSEKTSRVTLQQHYNFVMNQAVSITSVSYTHLRAHETR